MKASELGGGGSLRQNCQILSVSGPKTPPSSVSQYACKAGTFLPCPNIFNLTIDLTSYMTPQESGHESDKWSCIDGVFVGDLCTSSWVAQNCRVALSRQADAPPVESSFLHNKASPLGGSP